MDLASGSLNEGKSGSLLYILSGQVGNIQYVISM